MLISTISMGGSQKVTSLGNFSVNCSNFVEFLIFNHFCMPQNNSNVQSELVTSLINRPLSKTLQTLPQE